MLDKINPRDVFLGVFIVCIALYWWLNKRKYKLPPGPLALPIVGYIPFLSKDVHLDFIELQKKYGDIFSLQLGTSLNVVINEFKLMQEAFEQPLILDRPSDDFFSFQPGGFGFLGSSGSSWIEQRRYTMRALREIGLGKSQWIELLEAEVDDFIKIMESSAGKPVSLVKPLSASVSNNITSLIFGKRFPMGDPRRELVDQEVDATTQTIQSAGFLTFFPRLSSLIAKLTFSRISEALKVMEVFNNFIKKEILQRKIDMVDENQEIFIDEYLKEIEKRKDDPNTSFCEKELVGTIQAFVVAGSETTRTSLLWLLLAMAGHQNMQQKVHEEIERVLGKDGKCNWMDRNKLPYTYAAILEAQRWRTVAQIGVFHRAGDDTKVGGYDIPKGTYVISNLWAVHNDPRYWKEPEKFNPERFLLKDGTLMQQRPESFAPFSIGRRVCPGEFVALVEILHYFTAIIQKFHIQPPKDKQVNLVGITGATHAPAPQDLLFTLRD